MLLCHICIHSSPTKNIKNINDQDHPPRSSWHDFPPLQVIGCEADPATWWVYRDQSTCEGLKAEILARKPVEGQVVSLYHYLWNFSTIQPVELGTSSLYHYL